MGTLIKLRPTPSVHQTVEIFANLVEFQPFPYSSTKLYGYTNDKKRHDSSSSLLPNFITISAGLNGLNIQLHEYSSGGCIPKIHSHKNAEAWYEALFLILLHFKAEKNIGLYPQSFLASRRLETGILRIEKNITRVTIVIKKKRRQAKKRSIVELFSKLEFSNRISEKWRIRIFNSSYHSRTSIQLLYYSRNKQNLT